MPALLAGAVVIVALLWVGPWLLDWNTHRAAIEAAASGFIGRQVEIDGPIRLTLLPEPSITAEKVLVRDDGDGVRMSTRALTLNLSLGALLTGRVAVTHVALDRPDIRLPWPLPKGPISIEPPPWLASLSADVTGGSLSIGPLRVTNANLNVVTGGLSAALHIDGTANAGGAGWQAGIDLDWPQSNGSAPLQVTLQGTGTPASSFGFKGVMAANGHVRGRFLAHGDSLAAVVPAPALPFDASGTLNGDGRSMNITDLALNLGNMPASGEVKLRLTTLKAPFSSAPSLSISLHMPMLDLGPWLTAFPVGISKAAPLSLDLSADAAVFGDGLLRRFGVKLITSPTRIRVDDVHASLPGEASIALSGLYDPAALAFIGNMNLGVPSPAVTLHWLAQSKLLPDYSGALTGLSSLKITANVDADPQRAALTGIAGRMNDTTIAGGLVLGFGAKPTIAAGLDFGKIDLGEWLPPAWLVRPPRPDMVAHALSGVTADLRLSAGEVWLGAERIDHALLDAAISRGELNLRELAGQGQGMQVLASGAMSAAGQLRNARLVLAAPHATPFVALLPARLRGERAFWAEPLAATVTAAGPPDALVLAAQGSLGDLDFSAQPVLDLVHGRLQGAVTLRHPSASRLLHGLGYSNAAAWVGEGSFSVVATMKSDDKSWSVSPITFSLGMLHGTGNLARAAGALPGGRHVTGSLAIDTLPWPEPARDEPVPVDLLRGWQASLGITVGRVVDELTPVATDIHAHSDVADGKLHIAIARARYLGGTLTGAVDLAAADPPTLGATLSLTGAQLSAATAPAVAALPLQGTATTLDTHVSLQARGYSLNSWLASLNGKVDLAAAHGTLSGIDLGATLKPTSDETAGAVHASKLFTGSTPFDSLSATGIVTQGDLQVDAFRLSGAAGAMTASGQVDLVRGVCNLNLGLRPAAGAPLTAVLQGSISKPNEWLVRGTAMN
ncbi:MAG: AsmA family protein [Proteobacteria bacterium]|nr:AsmA family protein [Pseudomonadota bacterium]